MAGLFYLGLSWLTGYYLLQFCLPSLWRVNKEKSLLACGKSSFGSWLVILPASFLVGILVVTWATYLVAYRWREADKPLFWANLVVLSLLTLVLAGITLKRWRQKSGLLKPTKEGFFAFCRRNRTELILILLVTAFWSFFMFRSFYCAAGTMYVGYSVFSDFAPHLAVIRSFSVGNNFPTEYPHFAGEGIRYHFFFQFLTGNLEFLGLRIDWAFNLPSILSMLAFLLLLYAFALLLTDDKGVGLLTIVLFTFRSSFAFFTFMAGMESLPQAIIAILTNELHIGKTRHEEWGLWAQKVYVNQRHFAFALGVMVLLLIALYPLFRKMVAVLSERGKEQQITIPEAGTGADQAGGAGGTEEARPRLGWRRRISMLKPGLAEFFWTKDAWWPADFKRAVVLGLFLGLLAFWNGAVVLATLAILFVLALFSKHRLEYLVLAVLTVGLSMAQSRFFIGSGTGAVNPRLTVGFLAATPDLLGIAAYYLELLGLLPCLILAFFCTAPRGGRALTLAFLAPVIMATTLQVTPDIAVNHKYVIAAVLLLNILAAVYLVRFFAVRNIRAKGLAVLLVVLLILTGTVDLITLYNLDKKALVFRMDDPLLVWAMQNTEAHEIFLTPPYSNHPLLLAGRKIFCGWPYYPWSAGYDTYGRTQMVRSIYAGDDPARVVEMLQANNISYVVIDREVRSSVEYDLNYQLFVDHFVRVYTDHRQEIEIFKVPESGRP